MALMLPVPVPQPLGVVLKVAKTVSVPRVETVALMDALPQFEALESPEMEGVSEPVEEADTETLGRTVGDRVVLVVSDALKDPVAVPQGVGLEVEVCDTPGESEEAKLGVALVVDDEQSVGDKDVQLLGVGEKSGDKVPVTLPLKEGEGVVDTELQGVGEGQGVVLRVGLLDALSAPVKLPVPVSEGLGVPVPVPEGHCTGELEGDTVLVEFPEKEAKGEEVALGREVTEVVGQRVEERDPDAVGLILGEPESVGVMVGDWEAEPVVDAVGDTVEVRQAELDTKLEADELPTGEVDREEVGE